MNREQIQVGQVWMRKDGRKVELTEEREFRGSREFKLTPLDGGRTSWKWDGGVTNDLTFVSDKKAD